FAPLSASCVGIFVSSSCFEPLFLVEHGSGAVHSIRRRCISMRPARFFSAAVTLSLLALLLPATVWGQTTCTGFTFKTPVMVDNSRSASEPGIKVDSDGEIYINAPNGLIGPSRVWRSINNGASWAYVAPPNVDTTVAEIGGGDSDLSIDFAHNL